MKSITFLSGRTISIGDRVKVMSKYGTDGYGVVTDIIDVAVPRICVDMDKGTVLGPLDGWPLKNGGFYDRIRSEGIYGGEIVQ